MGKTSLSYIKMFYYLNEVKAYYQYKKQSIPQWNRQVFLMQAILKDFNISIRKDHLSMEKKIPHSVNYNVEKLVARKVNEIM